MPYFGARLGWPSAIANKGSYATRDERCAQMFLPEHWNICTALKELTGRQVLCLSAFDGRITCPARLPGEKERFNVPHGTVVQSLKAMA